MITDSGKYITVSFSGRKSRPQLWKRKEEDNLNIQATMKRRTQSAKVIQKIKKQALPEQKVNVKKSFLFESGVQRKKTMMIGSMRDREDLYQQNLQLKKQIHKLKSENTILRSKIQVPPKLSPQLEAKYQKQMYWTSNKSHLVSGIKFQYLKLKEKYSNLQNQNVHLKNQLYETKSPENKTYILELQKQNQRLANILRLALENNSSAPTKMLKTQVIATQLERVKETLVHSNQSMKNKDHKIEFLENRLIQLGNSEYRHTCNLKKEKKQKSSLQKENDALNKRIEFIKLQNMEKIQYFEKQIKHFGENEIKFKENIKKQLDFQTKILNKRIELLQEINLNLKIERDALKSEIQKYQQKETLSFAQQSLRFNPSYFSFQSQIMQQPQRNKVQDVQKNKNEDKGERKRKVANLPHSNESRKTRRIKFFNIQECLKMLKYRMIYFGVQIQEMMKLFDFRRKDGEQIDLQEYQWKLQYISLIQVKQILKKQPFILSQNDSQEIGRFLIEDCQQEYIYRDDSNQNFRIVVKSIMKNLVGAYQLVPKSIQSQFEEFIQAHSKFIGKALKNFTKEGKEIPVKKLFEVIKNLEIELNEGIRTMILARLSLHSQNLDCLCYQYLF